MSGLDKYLKYKELTYTRTHNLGNYESEKISITINLNHNDNIDEAFKKLKAKVLQLQTNKK